MRLGRLEKYLAVARTQIINSAAYPLDLAVRSITIVMFMAIFAQLWDTTYRAMGQTSIAGLSLNATMWYLMIAETIPFHHSCLTISPTKCLKIKRFCITRVRQFR